MKTSKPLGVLLCIITVLISITHIYYGYIVGEWAKTTLVFALPVTAMLLVATGLGFWLGWIMITTEQTNEEPEEAEEEIIE